jgi:hypothetical protein
MALNDKENRFLRHYSQLTNPSAAQKQTYNSLQVKSNPANPKFSDDKAERNYRHTNPLSEYTKSVDMRYLKDISNSLKNNAGVSDTQMNQYNNLAKKWNYKTDQQQPPKVDYKPTQPTQPDQTAPQYKPPTTQIEEKPFEFNHNEITYDQATNQVSQQVDPMYQRALENIKTQKYQNELNSGEMASKRGLAHSGLAADQLNKIAIASQGQIADTEAQRASKIAEMSQALVERDQDRAMQLRNQAFQEYMANQSLQRQDRAFDYDVYNNQYNSDYRNYRDNVSDNRYTDETAYKRALDQYEIDYGQYRDQVGDNRYQNEFDYQKTRDSRSDAEWESEQKWNREAWDKEFNRNNAEWESEQKYSREQQKKLFEYQKYRDQVSDQQNQEALQWEKSKFNSETEWRSYVYNNMSASEKSQLEWNKQQFGEEMAWRIEESNRSDKLSRDQMEYDAGFQMP